MGSSRQLIKAKTTDTKVKPTRHEDCPYLQLTDIATQAILRGKNVIRVHVGNTLLPSAVIRTGEAIRIIFMRPASKPADRLGRRFEIQMSANTSQRRQATRDIDLHSNIHLAVTMKLMRPEASNQ